MLRYFDTAGQLHHQDEEGNLFPTLLALDVPDRDEVETLIDCLLGPQQIMELGGKMAERRGAKFPATPFL